MLDETEGSAEYSHLHKLWVNPHFNLALVTQTTSERKLLTDIQHVAEHRIHVVSARFNFRVACVVLVTHHTGSRQCTDNGNYD